MIQITLRPIDGTSPSEERIQRPERPQRANPLPGNTSPLQSFIIRTRTGQSSSGREELPRPNAPVQDENYNNRSISPLFANQSTSLSADSNFHIHRIVPGSQHSHHPCEQPQTSRSQIADVDYTEAHSVSSANNQEHRAHTTPGPSSPVNHHHHHIPREDQQDHLRQRSWTDRNANNNNSGSSSDRMEEHLSQMNSVPRNQRRVERPILGHRMSRNANYRNENQESVSNIRNIWDRDRRSRPSRSGAAFSATSQSPVLPASPLSNRSVWESWSGVGGLIRRNRNGHRTEPNVIDDSLIIPPLINLVEGDEEHENIDNAGPILGISASDFVDDASIDDDLAQASHLSNNQNPEQRIVWAGPVMDSSLSLGGTLGDDINLMQHQVQQVEDNEEDNEILMSITPEGNRVQNNDLTAQSTNYQEAISLSTQQSRHTDVRQLVLSALECPVCFDYVSPPMVQCYEGHLVCNRCRIRLNHCPECRGPFSIVRPRAVEKIASFMEYPCTYEGCTQFVSPANRIIHAKSCNYRSYVCPISPTDCSWSGLKSLMRNHVENFHGRYVFWISGPKLTFTINPILGKEKIFVMEAMDRLFHIRFSVAPQDKLRGCVTLLGYDSNRTENLNVAVLVQSNDPPGPSLMVRRPPAEESDEMDMRIEKFAVFNISQLIQTAGAPSLIKVRVAIGKRDLLKVLDRIFD